MNLPRLLLMLLVAGVILTLMVAPAVWFADEGRRIKRGLKAILKGEVHGWLAARGRGRGFGLNFTDNLVAVTWDQGAWGYVYGLADLVGVEAIADGQVVARVHRGEVRRALDSLGGAESRVTLRLVFDDVAHPEFVLDLWLPQDEGRRDALTPTEALEECNRWLARFEALFRRPLARPPTPAAVMPSESAPAPAVAAAAVAVQAPLLLDDDTPPWEDDEEADEDADEAIT